MVFFLSASYSQDDRLGRPIRISMYTYFIGITDLARIKGREVLHDVMKMRNQVIGNMEMDMCPIGYHRLQAM